MRNSSKLVYTVVVSHETWLVTVKQTTSIYNINFLKLMEKSPKVVQSNTYLGALFCLIVEAGGSIANFGKKSFKFN